MTADWRASARCDTDTAHLFDALGDGDRTGRSIAVPRRILQAFAICRTCTVRTPCLEGAQ